MTATAASGGHGGARTVGGGGASQQSQAAASAPITGVRLKLVTLALILAPLVQVFDTTIVSIALRQMQGALSATQDQIAWVLTSYLLTVTVMTPLWGALGSIFGRKPLLLVAIFGFTVCAVLCGQSHSLEEVLLWRALQGFFGAALLPLAMSALLAVYPREEFGTAMAWWGVGVMFGPVFGPTIGGYVTEYLDWRGAFFLNLPVGLLAFVMVWAMVPRAGNRPRRPFNYFGFATLAVAIACLQFVLDRGQRLDWLDSSLVIGLLLVGFAAFWLFLVNSLTAKTPFIDPVIFRDRNYLGGTLLRTMFGVLLFGSMILLPPFLQEMGGYTVLDAGLMMAPRGLGTMLGSMFLTRLIAGLDPRKVIAASMLVIAVTMWELSTFTEDVERSHVIINGFIQGLGLAGFTVPLNSVAFSTLPDDQRDAGTSFYSLLNNIGRSIGIAIFSTYLAWASQTGRAVLNEHISPLNGALRHIAMPDAWSLTDPVGLANLERLVARQGKLLAYVADFQLLAVSIAVCIPVLFFMTDPRTTGRPVVMGGGG
jgi:DHA2 family multidrug resistance protein